MRYTRAFTLIELLVAVSIIGLLSSVVLRGVVSAKTRAIDSLVIQEVNQFRTLMEQNYSDFGSYSNLQHQPVMWFGSTADCNNQLSFGRISGPYAAKWVELCIKIVNTKSGSNFAGPANLSIGTYLGFFSPFDTATKFAIMAHLPGKDVYYCIGSSGRSSDTTTSLNYTLWDQPGCFYNP